MTTVEHVEERVDIVMLVLGAYSRTNFGLLYHFILESVWGLLTRSALLFACRVCGLLAGNHFLVLGHSQNCITQAVLEILNPRMELLVEFKCLRNCQDIAVVCGH